MITAGLLHDITSYVEGCVAKVVINGTYEIVDFEVKAVTDNMMALNYIVPFADISLITLIELLDTNDIILSSNPVNVPITADHMMLQTIEIKEATK